MSRTVIGECGDVIRRTHLSRLAAVVNDITARNLISYAIFMSPAHVHRIRSVLNVVNIMQLPHFLHAECYRTVVVTKYVKLPRSTVYRTYNFIVVIYIKHVAALHCYRHNDHLTVQL